MEFISKDPKYTASWLAHLDRFILQYKLFDKEEDLVLTVSGGIDSVTLLVAVTMLKRFGYSNKVKVININHNSREGLLREAQFVEDLCKHLEVDFVCEKLDGLKLDRNFEHEARLKRYDAFYKFAKNNEKVLLAHHIDDSFEWSLLQTLRSSSIEGLVGIPLINGRVIRPFMCFSKKQIQSFAKNLELPFIEDPTNISTKFERNFIRHEVISAFKDRYPKYIKHYTYRHNEIARRLGMHLVFSNRSQFDISFCEDSVLIYSLSNNSDMSGMESYIKQALDILNPNSRGMVSKQIDNIKVALQNNKIGPLALTNSVMAYLDHNLVLMTKKKSEKYHKEKLVFKEYDYEGFVDLLPDCMSNPKYHQDFPFVVIVKGSRLEKRNFNLSFRNEDINTYLTAKDCFYPALKLKREWSKKRNRHRILTICFLTSV